jgi:hypothetical protein
MRSRRSWPTDATVKARCSKVDSSDSRKNTTNSLESRNLREHKKCYSNTKKSTPIRMFQCHGQDVTASDVCLRHVD